MVRLGIIILFLLFTSCSRRESLGMKSHTFGQKGKHVVWLQVAGLDDQHLALLKLAKETTNVKIALERMDCSGSLWSYNLFDLRPSAFEGFNSQILGNGNIKGTCQDLDRKTVWNYFQDAGYEVGVFETASQPEDSLLKLKGCDTPFSLFRNLYFWKQGEGEGTFKTFHYQEKTGLSVPGIYYDKSCHGGECYVPFKTNVQSLWEEFSRKNSKTFTVVRDFSYLEALKKRDIVQAREILNELDKLLAYFIEKSSSQSLLVVLSTSASRGIEFPEQGRDWAAYEKKGKNILYKKTKLLSRVWSQGAGAENFCGVYEESELLKRFLWMPEKNILEFSF